MPVFQPNVPTGTLPLNQDYLNLQGNNQQLNIAYGYDHVPLTDISGLPAGGITGCHKTVHLISPSTTATNPPNNYPPNGLVTTPNIGQLISAQTNDGVNEDEMLFFLTGGGRLLQLTSNFAPVVGSGSSGSINGCTFLPGGIILQWGRIDSTSSSFKTLNFTDNGSNRNFPNNCFAVFTQPYGSGTAPATGNAATVTIRKSSFSNMKFEWAFVTASNEYSGFWWVAIGN